MMQSGRGGVAFSCAPCWLTAGTQGMRLSEQEGFKAAESQSQGWLLCSHVSEQRKGVRSKGGHTPAHFVLIATQGDQRYTAKPDLRHCPGHA